MQALRLGPGRLLGPSASLAAAGTGRRQLARSLSLDCQLSRLRARARSDSRDSGPESGPGAGHRASDNFFTGFHSESIGGRYQLWRTFLEHYSCSLAAMIPLCEKARYIPNLDTPGTLCLTKLQLHRKHRRMLEHVVIRKSVR